MFSMPQEPFIPTFLVGLPLARQALLFAREVHCGQRRESDEAPFILHPVEVAALLHATGHSEAVIAAGILHDTIEDSEIGAEAIQQRFGHEVAELVTAMTEDPDIAPYEERKAALRRQIAAFGAEATAVYAADQLCKVRELRAQASCDPGLLRGRHGDVGRRLEHYIESLGMLEEANPTHPLVGMLRFELEALRALPPRAVSAG
jgi:hypothetical protein